MKKVAKYEKIEIFFHLHSAPCDNNYIFHANVNVNLMEQNVIQINGGITISVDVSIKKLMYMKKIMFGILVNVFLEMKTI